MHRIPEGDIHRSSCGFVNPEWLNRNRRGTGDGGIDWLDPNIVSVSRRTKMESALELAEKGAGTGGEVIASDKFGDRKVDGGTRLQIEEG